MAEINEVAQKKTEFLGLLQKEYQDDSSGSNKKKLLYFEPSNKFVLRPGANIATSHCPAPVVAVTVRRELDDEAMVITVQWDAQAHRTLTMTVAVSEGIPEAVVEARRRRQKEKQFRAEERRRRQEEDRRKRNVLREAEREKNRDLRQGEKKAAFNARKAENAVSPC